MTKTENSPKTELDASIADWYMRRIKRFERSLVQIKGDELVLDIGCGLGGDAMIFYVMGARVIAADISISLLRDMKERIDSLESTVEDIHLVLCDIRNLPFENAAFDVIMCFSVLDHIKNKRDRKKSLTEIARTLKHYGKAIVTVPNSMNFPWKLINWVGQKTHVITYGYEHWFFPTELLRLLRNAGLKPSKLASSNFLPPPLTNKTTALRYKIWSVLRSNGKIENLFSQILLGSDLGTISLRPKKGKRK